jgi:hypothetical protein
MQGGSTTALINLTNALNKRKISTTMFGPHDWHLTKCKAKPTSKLKIHFSDYLVLHFVNPEKRYECRKTILSCHEQDVFPLVSVNYKYCDKIHYVSEHQRQYHNIQWPYFVLPNVLEPLQSRPKPEIKIGGVIGSIDRNKNVHISMRRALEDGCDHVLIYGKVTDKPYWEQYIKPYIDGEMIRYVGYCEDKEAMYASVTDVYHSSHRETWGYIKGECARTGTKFHGNQSTDGYWELPTDEIIDRWLEELEYDPK